MEKVTVQFTVLTNDELRTIVKKGTSSAGLAYAVLKEREEIKKKKLKSNI